MGVASRDRKRLLRQKAMEGIGLGSEVETLCQRAGGLSLSPSIRAGKWINYYGSAGDVVGVSMASLRAASVTAVRIRFRGRCTPAKIILTVAVSIRRRKGRGKPTSMFHVAICLRELARLFLNSSIGRLPDPLLRFSPLFFLFRSFFVI